MLLKIYMKNKKKIILYSPFENYNIALEIYDNEKKNKIKIYSSKINTNI